MSSNTQPVLGGRPLREECEGEGRQEPNRPEERLDDIFNFKDNECIRIVSQNINRIGQDMNGIKEQGVKSFIKDNKVDIMTL